MSVRVFLSWSGERSRRLAEELRGWLPAALQFVRPYFSPEDVEKGTRWGSEIMKELELSHVGIICVTNDNIEKPWLLFESGALSKISEKAKVCTLLFGVTAADVSGP